MNSFTRPGLVELGGFAIPNYQPPLGSMQMQASHVALPVQADPLSSSSNFFPSNFSVSPIPKNDVTTYASFFPSQFATTFPSPYVNNNMDFVGPFHAPQVSNYGQLPGYFPLVPSWPQPTTYPDLQHHHQFVSSPRHLEDACYPPSTYTIVAPRFSSYQTPYSPETNTQTSYSAPLRFLSPLQTSSSVNFPYTSTFGGDATEISEYSDPSHIRHCGPNPTNPPETSQNFHDYRQLDDVIDVQNNQALTMTLGFRETSEDSSRIDRLAHPSSKPSSSSVRSTTDAFTNKNVNCRRVRHLSPGEIPSCARQWYVENPKNMNGSDQKAIRDNAGNIPQSVYDLFYETILNKKSCKYCIWMKPIERRNRIEEHVRAHLGYKPLICSICHRAYNRKEDHGKYPHKFRA